MNLVVLTPGGAGIELAAGLAQLPEVRSLAVVTTRVNPRELRQRVRQRRHGFVRA